MEKGRAPFSLVIGRVTGGHYETVTASEAVLRGGAYFSPVSGEIGEVMAAMRSAIDAANAGDDFLRAGMDDIELDIPDRAVGRDP